MGREDAFTKVASVLQSATAGAAGTLLLEGTAGVGTTRFIDEVISRLDALHEPMTVLRGCSFGEATDPPYAPLVRALRPALAELPDDALAEIMGQATDELLGSCRSSPPASVPVAKRAATP